MREFARGIGLLARGFGYWRRRPGLMALGLVPATIVGTLLLAGLIALIAFLPGLTEAVTPFADGWPGLWASVIRMTIGTAVLGAALVLIAVSFTALTLVVGEPFYDRIWGAVEADLTSTATTRGSGTAADSPGIDAGYGFWRSVGDGISLVARGVGVAVLAALVSLIPVVGGVVGAVTGVLLTGWLLADELSSRALTARGLLRGERRALRRRHRARMLGFGVATQLCFLVPLGAVAAMPAAVAGSTLLARSLLDDQPPARPSAAPAS